MSTLKVLLVDDDKNIRQTLSVSLRAQDCDVSVVESAEEALKCLKQERFDFLLTDYRMNGKTGVELIEDTKSLLDPPLIVVMTAYASFENAVAAIQAGAFDYLPKPFTTDQLQHILKKVRAFTNLKKENARLKSLSGRPDYFLGMTSPAMSSLEDFVAKVSGSDATILLTGESGTGKSELGRLIHEKSARAEKPFVVVNCGTLTESLIESELFGHQKGAFTGATQDHVGKFELAQGGTLFIDEIGELSLSAQTRLLRFLQEKVFERVGGNRSIQVDARIIAATNKNLAEAVANGSFRQDLYFRLNVFECLIPALRYRKEDLPVLLERFIIEFSASTGDKELKTLNESVRKKLLEYSWPGNIRELRNCVERMILLSTGRVITEEDLPEAIKKGARSQTDKTKFQPRRLDEVEREQIEKVLEVEPNQERAAELLGITTVTLWRKRKEYGLP